jgi:dCTP deaminase
LLPVARHYPSYATTEQLQAKIMQRQREIGFMGSEQSTPGIAGFRETTAEEKAAFKPMIEPFFGKQIRMNERNGTKEETLFLKANGVGAMSERLKVPPENFRVDPLLGLQVREKVISYGLSSYGYDVRCSREFKVFTNVHSTVVDPKNFDAKSFVDMEGDYVVIPPNSFALARTIEYFRIPRDVLTVCLGKSTYARCGIIVNVTPFEPEWEGHVTLEFSNTTPLPAKIYAGEGCAQVLFFRGSEPCATSYADRGGKYQGQTGITIPKA